MNSEESERIIAAARYRRSTGPIDDLAATSKYDHRRTNYGAQYIDPHDHSTLDELVADWHITTRRQARACRLVHPIETCLVVALPPPGNTLRHFILSRSLNSTHATEIITFPGGPCTFDRLAEVARGTFRQVTGMKLANARLVGCLVPSEPEARELRDPWITYVVAGEALSVEEAIAEAKPKKAPLSVRVEHLSSVRGTTNIPLIASLTASRNIQFAIEPETHSGAYAARVTLYRTITTSPTEPIEYGLYPHH